MSVPTIDQCGSQLLTADHAHDLAGRFVTQLRSQGVPARGRVLLQASNSAYLLAAVLGCLLGGYAPVLIGTRVTDRERREAYADVEPHLSLTETQLAAAFGETASSQLSPAPHCRPMHFTSGTSGRPKGVWSGWFCDGEGDEWCADEWLAWQMSPTDVHLAFAPMSHSAPLRFPLMTLLAGGSVVIPRSTDPAVAAGLIERGEVSTAFLAPVHLQRMLDATAPRAHRLRLLAHAGSACPEQVRAAARSCFGDDPLREFYGSTEGQFTICTPGEFDRHPGTVGRARAKRSLRTDEASRIWCRPPGHARFEYWRDPAKTAEAWDGGWFTVGDLGRLDGDGYLYLEGRRTDLIITGGVNVYPAEVERVVLDVPGVDHAVVFGLPDERWGQRVSLAVTGTATVASVQAVCEEQLAPYKRPKAVYALDALPITDSGKVDRGAVARLFHSD